MLDSTRNLCSPTVSLMESSRPLISIESPSTSTSRSLALSGISIRTVPLFVATRKTIQNSRSAAKPANPTATWDDTGGRLPDERANRRATGGALPTLMANLPVGSSTIVSAEDENAPHGVLNVNDCSGASNEASKAATNSWALW